MGTVLSQIRQYKKETLLTPLFAALEVVMEVLLPFVTALIIDEGLQKSNINNVLRYGVLIDVYKRQIHARGQRRAPAAAHPRLPDPDPADQRRRGKIGRAHV